MFFFSNFCCFLIHDKWNKGRNEESGKYFIMICFNNTQRDISCASSRERKRDRKRSFLAFCNREKRLICFLNQENLWIEFSRTKNFLVAKVRYWFVLQCCSKANNHRGKSSPMSLCTIKTLKKSHLSFWPDFGAEE